MEEFSHSKALSGQWEEKGARILTLPHLHTEKKANCAKFGHVFLYHYEVTFFFYIRRKNFSFKFVSLIYNINI